MRNFSLVFAVLALSASAQAAPTSYPLQCRGGSGTLGYDSNIRTAQFYYSKAPHKAGLGLAAGQCAWLDRAIGPNEPTCVWHANVNTQVYIFPAAASVATSYFASNQAPWLGRLKSASNYVTFRAYNPGTGGCFVVTSVDP